MNISHARQLVIHGGAAHRDDLLTACVLLAANEGLIIERRDPLAEELADSSVIVADVGLRYEPALNNYDHHQFPPDSEPSCALTLVLRTLGLEVAARLAWPWLSLTELADARGPAAVARHLGLSLDALHTTYSPVECIFLRQFSGIQHVAPGTPLHAHLHDLGRGLLSELDAIGQRLQLLEIQAVRLTIGSVQALDLRTIDPEPLLAIETFCQRSAPDTAILITRNQRGPGWALWRRNDHPRVDFRRLRGHSQASFIHSTGFMAVLRSDSDLLALALQACS